MPPLKVGLIGCGKIAQSVHLNELNQLPDVELVALDYPHETWVLDEGDNDRVKSLCQRVGASHFSRKNLKQYQTESDVFQSHSKHGNYNAWLYEIAFKQYDVITAFDPDQIADL